MGPRGEEGNALHASLAGSDESGSVKSTVVENGDVVLVGRVPSLREHDLPARVSSRLFPPICYVGRTVLQSRPAAPVCLVMRLRPII